MARTVLVLEADRGLLSLLHHALRGAGYHVAPATTVDAALALLAEVRIDAIFADPPRGVEPWHALEPVRRAAAGRPLIVCSPLPPEMLIGFATRGYANVLPMPFDLDGLLMTLDGLLMTVRRVILEGGDVPLSQEERPQLLALAGKEA